MGWDQIDERPDPDRHNQPDPEYEFRSTGHVERTILQQLTTWHEPTDEFGAAWPDGKPTNWLFKPVAAVRDPSVRWQTASRGDEFDADDATETTVRRALGRLREQGLVERGEHPDDGRKAMWNVTDDGVTEAAMLADRYAADLAALKKRYGVTDDDRSTIGSYWWPEFAEKRGLNE